MVNEAKEHEAEDKERREQIERRNKLDNLCYTLEKTIAESKDKIGDVTSIEALIREGRQAVEKQDDEAVKSVSERLEKEAHRIASVMYQAAGGQPGAGGPGGPTDGGPGADGGAPGGEAAGKKKDGGVIDAEFEETP
jgi:molecular chaperone DnaK